MIALAEWAGFALALTAFLAAHVIPSRPLLRGMLIARMGQAGYIAAYSLLSLALLWWLIVAAGNAPRVMLWDLGRAARWLVNLAMPVAVGLGTFAIGAPNPLSFGGRAMGFDPDRPGSAGITRHPLPWALLIWASAHLLANGEVAHVILFAIFAGFSVLGMIAIDARNRRRLGAEAFARLSARAPLMPLTQGWPRGWGGVTGITLRLAIAMTLWIGLYHLHGPVIGLPPSP